MQLLMQYWCLATALEAEPQTHLSGLTYAAILDSFGVLDIQLNPSSFLGDSIIHNPCRNGDR